MNVQAPNPERDYLPIADHGLYAQLLDPIEQSDPLLYFSIGNLRTAALISLDGSVESYCIPNFDSPSVFARILDKNKGGHFSITPTVPFVTKQNYLPSSNVLQTKFLNDKGVVVVTDFLPRQADGETKRPMLFWLIRRVEVIRGTLPLRVECAPAFNYARDSHTTEIVVDDTVPFQTQNKVAFSSPNLDLDLRYVAESTIDNVPAPKVNLDLLDISSQGHLGPATYCNLSLVEGQRVTFVLRIRPEQGFPVKIKPTQAQADELGVPLEKVMKGVAKLRPDEDPALTKVHLNLSPGKVTLLIPTTT
ncbi:hypothetical protein J3R82DRAFT_7584 [Butyriboletus roseoflavus]|nr:hypothetical protein J3R82DRAFT_7584 [Butyriboletus roseoflavus]